MQDAKAIEQARKQLGNASRKLMTVYEIIEEYERTGNVMISTDLVKALLEPARRAMLNDEITER